MSPLPILTGADNPILRTPTKKVGKATKDVLKLIDGMADAVKRADGLGLAAPQVGVSLRLCLARIGGKMTPLIDPMIIRRSSESKNAEEGCLSLPGVWVQVPRAVSIVLRYRNLKNEEQERRLDAMDARIVQHEVDHLEGTLIVDYA